MSTGSSPGGEDQFRLLAERGQDLVYRLRLVPEAALEYVSPAATRLTGYTPDELYADPDLWRRLVHPDDRELLDRVSELLVEPSEVEEPVVLRWIRRDGTILWTEHRSVPLFDVDGNMVAIEGVSRDITRRIEAEEHLRASEARFREFLSDIDLGALMLDADGTVVFINDHLLGLLERTRDEMLGQDWIDLAIPEAERVALRQVLLDAIRTGSLSGTREDTIVTQSGQERRLSWTSVTQRDTEGRVVGLASIAHDVTELHRVEAERALLAAAVEQTAEAIVVTDPTAKIVFVNPAFERVSGYSRDEVLGQNPRLLQASAQDPGQFEEMWSTLRAGQTWQGELANIRRDGTEYTDSVTITPIFDPIGELSAYMSVQRDVSHLREVEADLGLEARVRTLLSESFQVAATTTALEDAARALCNGLASLAEIDVVHLVAFLGQDEAVVIASCAPDGFPIEAGDRLPPERARYLLERSSTGPWGEHTANTSPGDAIGAAMRGMGIEALAFGPIRLGDGVGGVVVVGTRDKRSTALVAEKMPALVGFGASANHHLVDRLRARREEVDLRRTFDAVLRTRAFRTVFQPIVELESGEHVGYEALSRFDSGEPPDICFAQAWSVGIGPELELATLEAAIESARELPAGRWLSLNASPRLLDASDRLATVLGAAERPIVIEITEHQMIVDYAATRDAVRALRSGIRLAVDDAGVGIANFGHIVELRPDLVKIDISLVRRVNVDLGRQALVVAMRHFARTSGCRLIAEGVESEEEARTLTQLRVEFGQGYRFGRPEPVEHWSAEPA